MKHTKTEDEYIWVHELQTRMARLEKEQQAQTQAEKFRLKELHWMHCPKCGQELATETCDSGRNRRLPELQGCVVGRGRIGNHRGEHKQFLPLVPANSSRARPPFGPSGVRAGSRASRLTA